MYQRGSGDFVHCTSDVLVDFHVSRHGARACLLCVEGHLESLHCWLTPDDDELRLERLEYLLDELQMKAKVVITFVELVTGKARAQAICHI